MTSRPKVITFDCYGTLINFDMAGITRKFYDLISAYDLGIRNKVWINRRHEPESPYYEYAQLKDISERPSLVGL